MLYKIYKNYKCRYPTHTFDIKLEIRYVNLSNIYGEFDSPMKLGVWDLVYVSDVKKGSPCSSIHIRSLRVSHF